MSRRSSIKVNPYSFHLVLYAIKKFEKEDKAILVDDMSLSAFLIAHSNVGKSSISIEVKIVVLGTIGYFNPNEELIKKLKDSREMSDLDLSDLDYISLTGEINKIIKRHNPNVKVVQVIKVKKCETVGDLVKLVEGIAYP